jgi:hypothetical protein
MVYSPSDTFVKKRNHNMIYTAVIGTLCITVFSLGMAPSHESASCTSLCFSPLLMTCLQPSEMEREHPRGPGGMDREHRGPNGMKPRMAPNANTQRERTQRMMQVDMVEHIMAVAKEIDPDLAAQLALICESDPEAFQKICRRQGQRLGSLIRLRESDPELYELKVTELKTDAEIYKVTEGLRGLDSEEPQTYAKIAALQGLVRARTALSLRAQTLHLSRLEEHIKGLKHKLQDTSDRFDEIVEERVAQLLMSIRKTSKSETTQAE